MIDRVTGRIGHVWNSLCSNRHRLIVPQLLPGQRLGDLGPGRRGRSSREPAG